MCYWPSKHFNASKNIIGTSTSVQNWIKRTVMVKINSWASMSEGAHKKEGGAHSCPFNTHWEWLLEYGWWRQDPKGESGVETPPFDRKFS